MLCEAMRRYSQVAEEGLELPPKTSGNVEVSAESGAECGALGAREARIDPDLAAVVDTWPKLPEAIRVGVLAIIRAAGGPD